MLLIRLSKIRGSLDQGESIISRFDLFLGRLSFLREGLTSIPSALCGIVEFPFRGPIPQWIQEYSSDVSLEPYSRQHIQAVKHSAMHETRSASLSGFNGLEFRVPSPKLQRPLVAQVVLQLLCSKTVNLL